MRRLRFPHAPLCEVKNQIIKAAASVLTLCLLVTSFPVTAVLGKTKKTPPPKSGTIFILSPKLAATGSTPATGNNVVLRYNVNDPDITSVNIMVMQGIHAASHLANLSSARVYLYKGVNTVTLTGLKNGVVDDAAVLKLSIECNSECIGDTPPAGGMIQAIGGDPPAIQGQTPPPVVGGAKNIILQLPDDGIVTDVSTFEPTIVIPEPSGISRLIITVDQNGQSVDYKSDLKVKYDNGFAIIRPTLKVRSGKNDIHVFDPLHFGQPSYETKSQLECKGTKCESGPVATTSPAPVASPTTSPAASATAVTSEQKGSIHITPPTGEVKLADDSSIPLKLTVEPNTDPKNNVKSIFVSVKNEKNLIEQGGPKEVTFPDPKKAVELTQNVKVGKGANIILVFDPTRPDDERNLITLNCDEKKCEVPAVAKDKEKEPKIKLEKPKKGSKEAEVIDVGSVDSYLTIAKDSKIENIQYTVYNGDIVHTSEKFAVPAPDGDKPIEMRIPLAILKGTNTIRFFDAANAGSNEDAASTVVICKGDGCPTDFLIAKFPSSGQNSRVIVGLEQAGGSSASSKTKPILDFFFMTPFFFDRRHSCGDEPTLVNTAEEKLEKKRAEYLECVDENSRRRSLPRFGFWGDVRLASTPEQIAAAQVFPSSVVNQVTTPGRFIDLVTSFDFMAGLEARIKTANGNFLSLIPGIRQKSSLYFAAGGGAISPLEARRESVQIFNIPDKNDPRRDEFLKRFTLDGKIPPQPDSTTTPPAEKAFVAVLPIDRDRFLRQWYAGLRLKTFYCEDLACTRFKNSFPAIVDFMFGQNEAVTGGSLKRGGKPDPQNAEKLINRTRSYVIRVDGFYPFPVREASFLFFYGSAIMKIGGGGVNITTPLFLDNPGTTVELSDSRVYIPPINILKLQQPDRDYYKIGVGINLTDLFNRNKPKP